MIRNSLFADSVVVNTAVVNSSQIRLSWITPQSLIDQGLSQYQITVTSQCSTGEVSAPQRFTVTPSDPSSLTISGLGKISIGIPDNSNIYTHYTNSSPL